MTNYKVGDIIILRKNHPCQKKANRFKVLETGALCKIECLNCHHVVIYERDKLNSACIKIETPEK